MGDSPHDGHKGVVVVKFEEMLKDGGYLATG